MENCNSKMKTSIRKWIKWFEPAGLILLLVSFGWQCLEEHSAQMKTDAYILEINEKLLFIWDGIYDEAIRSDRYDGKAMVWVNYDSHNQSMKTWEQTQKELSDISKQKELFGSIRMVLFVIGSLLVILSKIPCLKNKT